MIVGIVAILTIFMGGFYYLETTLLRRHLIKNLEESSTHYLSNIIKGSLKHAMLTRDLDEVRYIMKTVQGQREVLDIFLVNKLGDAVIYSGSPIEKRHFSLSEPTCQICHRFKPKDRSTTVLFTNREGREIFRNVNPIHNEPECYGCHDSSNKVNGVLITDFSLQGIQEQLDRDFRRSMFSLAFLLLVVVGGLSFSVDRLVLARLQNFVAAAKRFGLGDFNQRISETSRDEIGELSSAFNQMAADLSRSQAIRERKDLLENVLNSVTEAVLIIDDKGRVVACNRGFVILFGSAEEAVLGRLYQNLGEPRAHLWTSARKGHTHREELPMTRSDSHTFPAHVSLIPLKDEMDGLIGFVEVVQDLSEAKFKEAIQHQLAQVEKAAAVGRLAAGVAHELNNPLGNILLFAKLVLEDCPPEDPRLENLNRVVENARRGKLIISALLDFTRERAINRKPCDLEELAEESLGTLHPALEEAQIGVSLEAEEGLPSVKCDPGQIQQVFVNLVQNAMQAMGSSGSIDVVLRRAVEAEEVVLSVKDRGPGIPEENLSKVFEPFFSTKDDGSGLGLSICYGIVERHVGRIWVENNPDGAGCTFFVSLPLDAEGGKLENKS
jgi:PAS domain S-box-containing protein